MNLVPLGSIRLWGKGDGKFLSPKYQHSSYGFLSENIGDNFNLSSWQPGTPFPRAGDGFPCGMNLNSRQGKGEGDYMEDLEIIVDYDPTLSLPQAVKKIVLVSDFWTWSTIP